MASRCILILAPAQAVMDIFPRLQEAGIEVGMAENLKGARGFIEKSSPVMVFSRPWMPGYKAEDLLELTQSANGGSGSGSAGPPVVVFTDKGSAQEAQRFLQLGAKDYWLEPLTWDKVAAMLPEDAPSPAEKPSGAAAPEAPSASQAPAAAQAASPAQPAKPAKSGRPAFRIIGKDPAVARVLALAKQVAPSKASVLIAGESGTGKEMFARYLHAHSDRPDAPFVAVNCAALPEHLLESELFGHEKGAFTGAIGRKLGRFEMADGGTLLLDEISEMDLGLQAKLLRVLQEGELDRVGGTETVSVDVRVLATTNRELEQWVEDGKFRQDLYFRLNVIPLTLPALRERGDDSVLLAQFFIARFCAQYNLGAMGLTQEAAGWIREYDWPGNVRELQNLMERAVLLAGAGPIRKVHFLLDPDSWPLEGDAILDDGTTPLAPLVPDDAEPEQAGGGDDATAMARAAIEPGNVMGGQVISLHEMERIMIMRGLEHTSGNRTRAAEILGISVRTLRNKLNEYRDQGHEV